MENMEVNDMMVTEAVEDVAEAIPTGKSGLKTMAKAGFIMAASIAGWELMVKPLGHKLKGVWLKRKAAKKAEADEMDVTEVDLDEIPEIED